LLTAGCGFAKITNALLRDSRQEKTEEH
jgi:hypothetical protein